jgi:lysophospholipase L1-like esterase
MANILVFGDSITYGACDKEGGWVQRLRKFLDEKKPTNPEFYYLVYNLGISGDTSEDLLNRFESETNKRLDEEEETIFLFAIGANDSQFINSKNKLPLDKFQNNIQKIIELAEKYSQRIVFFGLFPCDESKTVPIPWDTAKSYKNEHIKKYNEIVKSVCAKNKIPFVEIFEIFIKENYQELLEDGLHPNSEGHEKIFKVARASLVKYKII